MSFTETKRREIKNYILRKIDEDDADLVAKTTDAFGISATSVKRYLDAEVEDSHITKSEQADCRYGLVFKRIDYHYDIRSITEREDYVLYEDILPVLDVNDNAKRIWRYVLPEIFNNALEHSEGKKVEAYLESCCLYTRICLTDDGIGIFRKVTESLKQYGYTSPTLENAVTELYKGKFTSDPDNHTGEGIFFSMRLSDRFSIVSDGMILRSGYLGEPSVIRSHILAYATKLSKKGTVVIMQLENDTRRDLSEVFSEYANIDDGFIRTKIPVFEACMDRDPVARSQARRLAARLTSFTEVVLDFEKVDIMGQGFADELFRVFAKAHPEVKLTPINMNDFTYKMYLHSIHNKVVVPIFSNV